MIKYTYSILIGLLIYSLQAAIYFPPAHAQFQDEFELDLPLPEPKSPEPAPYKFSIDANITNTYNNHIELGLSVDPYTSSLAGQESPQLQGIINQFNMNLRGDLSLTDKFRIQLQLTPQYDNYNGKEGKLNEFDAFYGVSLTEFGFRPFSSFPEFVASHQFQRLSRSLDVYNNIEQRVGLRVGRVLEYNLRHQRFDDESQLREDFLLIGSTNHKVTSRIQFGLMEQMIGKLEFGVEYGRYQTNLNNLILGIAQIEDDERRSDWRHFSTLKLLQTAAERIVLQEEINFFLNRSNIEFFNFASLETAASSYYKIDSGRWIRLRFSRVWVRFEGRQIQDISGIVLEDADNRNDSQWGINSQFNWKFTPYLSLIVDYQYTHNRTNELDPILDFLNYNHNIVSISLRGNY